MCACMCGRVNPFLVKFSRKAELSRCLKSGLLLLLDINDITYIEGFKSSPSLQNFRVDSNNNYENIIKRPCAPRTHEMLFTRNVILIRLKESVFFLMH